MQNTEDTGAGMDNVNRGIVDFGAQECFPSDAILKINEPFTPEPPELTAKKDRDVFVQIFQRISQEAYTNPGIDKKPPYDCSISKIDTSPSKDPFKWILK